MRRVVAASDIQVHREVYGGGAEYFSPYSVGDAAQAIDRLVDEGQDERRRRLIAEGALVAARYAPERILPQWRDFLDRIVREPRAAG